MIIPETEKSTITHTREADDTFTMLNPDEDDNLTGDWDDDDDEVFEDLLDDENNIHDAEVENGIFDEGDEDHMPNGDDL